MEVIATGGDHWFICDECHEGEIFRMVDGRELCKGCLERMGYGHERKGTFYMNPGLYRIAYTFSSMYDDTPELYTTLEKVAYKAGVLPGALSADRFGRDPMLFNYGFGLSGHIDDAHWKIYAKDRMFAYVYEPPETEAAKLMKLRSRSGRPLDVKPEDKPHPIEQIIRDAIKKMMKKWADSAETRNTQARRAAWRKKKRRQARRARRCGPRGQCLTISP